jgi:hypothetical protein
MNAGNFKLACPSLPVKSMGYGRHSIDWVAPKGGIPIAPFTFWVATPSTTPVYVVNTALAKTTLVPKTWTQITVSTVSVRKTRKTPLRAMGEQC